MKTLIPYIIFLQFLIYSDCKAQAKSIYFEIGGPGLASVNYDMRFQKTENGFGGRVGIGGFSLGNRSGSGNASVLFIPVGINYLLSKDEKNYFEIGGGITPVIVNDNSDDRNFTTTFGHLNFGYRLQPKNGGFLFRAGIVPIFNKNGFIPYYFGLSFGYKF